jgi:hypothetical protein
MLTLLKVVCQASAVLGYPGEEALPVDTNHNSLGKIQKTESQHWISIYGALTRLLRDLDLGSKYDALLSSNPS